MLRFTLPKMDFRGADPRVYKLIELFLAMAYFRIPGFRDKILGCLQKKMWEEL